MLDLNNELVYVGPMSPRILNSSLDEHGISVEVEGVRESAWIDIDALIRNYHGDGRPTRDSIQAAIFRWVSDYQAESSDREQAA